MSLTKISPNMLDTNNVIDDGSGNMTVSAGLTVTNTIDINSGDLIFTSDSTEKHVKLYDSSTGSHWGMYLNGTGMGLYDWDGGGFAFSFNHSNKAIGIGSGPPSNGIATPNNTLDDGSGNMKLSGSITTNGPAYINAQLQSFTGTTSGTVYWVQDMQGTVKRLMIYFDSYENDTSAAQTITIPTVFTYNPVTIANTTGMSVVALNTSGGISWNTTTVYINPYTTTAFTGYIIIEGF